MDPVKQSNTNQILVLFKLNEQFEWDWFEISVETCIGRNWGLLQPVTLGHCNAKAKKVSSNQDSNTETCVRGFGNRRGRERKYSGGGWWEEWRLRDEKPSWDFWRSEWEPVWRSLMPKPKSKSIVSSSSSLSSSPSLPPFLRWLTMGPGPSGDVWIWNQGVPDSKRRRSSSSLISPLFNETRYESKEFSH